MDESTCWRRLTAATIVQAVSDYTKNHDDEDALAFLQSRAVKSLLRLFGLDPGRVYKQLPSLPPPKAWGHSKEKPFDRKDRRRSYHSRAQRLREQGLNSNGRRLARSCYNCAHIRRRQDLNGWLACSQGKSKPRPAKAMTQHTGCETWELRTQQEISEI